MNKFFEIKKESGIAVVIFSRENRTVGCCWIRSADAGSIEVNSSKNPGGASDSPVFYCQGSHWYFCPVRQAKEVSLTRWGLQKKIQLTIFRIFYVFYVFALLIRILLEVLVTEINHLMVWFFRNLHPIFKRSCLTVSEWLYDFDYIDFCIWFLLLRLVLLFLYSLLHFSLVSHVLLPFISFCFICLVLNKW